MRIQIPTPEEFAAALEVSSNMSAEVLGPVIQRDIARMIEIAHLATEAEFLGAGAVLSGGVAMRLRGSSRLSRIDTDLSTTPEPGIEDEEILDVLEVDEPEIQIRPPRRLTGDRDVRKAFPVKFRFRDPPAPLDEDDRRFRVDIAARGLDLEPEPLELRHEYPFDLGIEGVSVPTIALPEAVAEKAFSFGAFRLAKHYADLAYAVDHFNDRLEADMQTLRDLTALKLERNVEQFPGLMKQAGITDYASLKPPFVQDHYLRVVKAQWEQAVGYVGQASEHYTFDRALELVCERLVPLLF